MDILLLSRLLLTLLLASIAYPTLSQTVAPDYFEQRRMDQEQRSTDKSWSKTLQKEGYLDKTVRGPYRVALPLARFGDVDLKATYAPVPGSERRAGIVFFRIPLD